MSDNYSSMFEDNHATNEADIKDYQSLINKISSLEQEKAVLGERVESLTTQRNEIVAKLKELNVNPQTLPETIQKAQEELTALYAEANQILTKNNPNEGGM